MNGGPDMIRKLMPMANREMAEPFLEKVDILKYGGDLLQAAAYHGKHDVLELLIERGADINSPPEKINGEDAYRKTPYVIQAVMGGNIPTLESVLKYGGAL